jgi:hypothetical protein
MFHGADQQRPHAQGVSERPAVRRFAEWCEGRGIGERVAVQPFHVAAFIKELQGGFAPPTVEQHMAASRMPFDWLVTGHILDVNPAHAVRGPKFPLLGGREWPALCHCRAWVQETRKGREWRSSGKFVSGRTVEKNCEWEIGPVGVSGAKNGPPGARLRVRGPVRAFRTIPVLDRFGWTALSRAGPFLNTEIALDRRTSVNQLVRQYLAALVDEDSRKRLARARLMQVSGTGLVEVGDRTWSRDDLYER